MRTYPKHKGSGVPWLGDIPEGWSLCRAKYLFALENRPVEQGAGVVTCFRDGQVTLRSNRRTAGFTESLKETGYQGVKKGDLVIHQMDAFAGAVGVSDSDGKSTPVYSVCTPKRPLSPFFIAYQIREMARSNYIVSLSRGIRQRSSDFRFPVFANCMLALPSLVEQRSITNYLDKQSAEIDEMVSRRRQLIEKLRELKKSIIARAVTKGIRPNRPMKDSGVPWLGEVPGEWELCRGKYLFALVNRPAEQGAGVVTCFRDGQVTLRSNRRTAGFTESLKETGYQGVKKGDLVIHQMDAFAGAVGVSDSDGKSTPVYSVCTPKRPLSPFFIAYQIREMARSNYIVSLSRGIRQRSSDFRFPVFANCVLALPSLAEQRSITNYLDKKCAEIDEMIARHMGIIEKLKELKVSLIANVVTGKVDVREQPNKTKRTQPCQLT